MYGKLYMYLNTLRQMSFQVSHFGAAASRIIIKPPTVIFCVQVDLKSVGQSHFSKRLTPMSNSLFDRECLKVKFKQEAQLML